MQYNWLVMVATEYSELPRVPALYAMYGGYRSRPWVAYVGISSDLNSRIVQHFDRRDSSVVTGVAAAGINVDAVRFVRWWEHPDFVDKPKLHAAESVAFDVLDPALRSRGRLIGAAAELAKDPAFRQTIHDLLTGEAAGQYDPPRIDDLARRVRALESTVEELRDLLSKATPFAD